MIMRTIRAVLVTALTWGVAWSVVGALFGLFEFFRFPPESSYFLALRFYLVGPMTVLGIAGLLGGAAFAALLSRAERGQSLDTIASWRAAAWGALGGLAFSAAGVGLAASTFGVREVLDLATIFWAAVAAVCGAISAAGSLAIARKGTPGLLEEAEKAAAQLRALILVAAGTLAVACSPPAEDSTRPGLSMRIDSTGNFPVLTVSGEPEEWALESLTIVRPEPTVGFARVRSIALDPAGGVWIGELQENRLLRYGDDGQLMESRGRQGAGPGEFSRPSVITTHQGALLLFDASAARVTRWTPSGALDSIWTVPGITTGGSEVYWHPASDGPRIWQWARRAGVLFDAYLRVPPRGAHDTIAAPQGPWPRVPTEECPDNKGNIWIWPSPFHPVLARAPYLGGKAVNVGSEYRIAIMDEAGDTLRILVHDVPRAPVTDADWLEGTSESRAGHDTLTLSGCTGEQVRYPLKPAIEQLVTDEDGRLWVKRLAVGGVVWEAWRGDTLLGKVTAPTQRGMSRPSFLGDRMAVLQEGPEGGYQVAIFRMVSRP